MFVFPILNNTVYINIGTILSLIICVVTSVFTSKKHIDVVKKEVAIPILILNWLCIAVYAVDVLFTYRNIIQLILIIIFVLWHTINIIKLNRRKNIPQNIPVIHCDSCGIALPANSVFCTKCGSKITIKDARSE